MKPSYHMSAGKKLAMEESTANIRKFTKIKKHLKTSNIFYVGINFCVQGTFFLQEFIFGKGVKTFYLREKCLHKGSKYHF